LDGGQSWQPVDLGGLEVKSVLSIRGSSEGQIDLLVSQGEQCVVSVISSFTNGDYWGAYPERAGEFAQISAGEDSITFSGATYNVPCSTPRQVDSTSLGLVLGCDDGLYNLSFVDGVWFPMFTGAVSAYELTADGLSVAFVTADTATCAEGLVVMHISTASAVETSTALCAPPDAGAAAAYSASAGATWLMTGSGDIYKSDADGSFLPASAQ
jgi:hypothetical protein